MSKKALHHCSRWSSLVLLLAVFSLLPRSIAGKKRSDSICEEQDPVVKDLIDWIKENGGIIDDRQVVKRLVPEDDMSGRHVYATAFIPKDTVLLAIPWDLAIEPDEDLATDNNDDDGSEVDKLCDMIEELKDEFKEHAKGQSEYGPYVEYLKSLKYDLVVPNGWSRSGKELLSAMLGENLMPGSGQIDRHLRIWQERCGGDLEHDEAGKHAALLVMGHRSPNVSEDEDDEDWHYMVPFYDLYSPRFHGASAMLFQDEEQLRIEVIASRDIEPGETIHTSRVFGFLADELKPFIHKDTIGPRFSFTFYDKSAASLSEKVVVEFDYQMNGVDGESKEENVKTAFSWADGIRAPNRAYAFLQAELTRLRKIVSLLNLDDFYLLFPVRDHEKKAVLKCAHDLIGVLSAVIEMEHEPGPITPYTFMDYEVAGVNLATYRVSGVEQATPENAIEKPYELFENFNIGQMIIGNENWDDMIEYRRKLERSSLSFYVDKVARKRWLPSQGIPQGEQFVLLYGFELTASGDIHDEIKALHELIPDSKSYAAKPSHKSLSNGVWLARYDVTKKKSVFHTPGYNESSPLSKWNISRSLAEDLHTQAHFEESLVLKNVRSGVVVEDLLVEVEKGSGSPIEFNMFVVWGKLWVAKMVALEEKPEYSTTWIYRNESHPEGASHPPELDYVDWPRLVKIAETLGANKDMIRIDVFVGLPMQSHHLWVNGTREERIAAAVYVVSESEIYPTTSFRRRPGLAQEGARLWVAGYKIGNFRTVPNTEIPRPFLEHGYLLKEDVASSS